MVSLFSFSQIKGERIPFIGKGMPHFLVSFQCGIASHKGKKSQASKCGAYTSLPCNFSMWDCLPQKKKNPKPQNLGSTILFIICEPSLV